MQEIQISYETIQIQSLVPQKNMLALYYLCKVKK